MTTNDKYSYDVFISYAWSKERSEWVRLLASHLHLMGFQVGLDNNLPYGDDLIAFMKSLSNARHVLVIVDQTYLERAQTAGTGVATESQQI